MQQSSATPSLHLWLWGVAEDCCMLSILLAVPSCIYSFWYGIIPTSYFIFNDFYTCIIIIRKLNGALLHGNRSEDLGSFRIMRARIWRKSQFGRFPYSILATFSSYFGSISR